MDMAGIENLALGSIPCMGCFGFVLVVIAVLAIIYIVSLINGLISLRNQIDKSWANIDVLLKQRGDLVPNLVEIVKGYMKYERQTLTEITKLRADVMSAETPSRKAKPSEAISSALKTIFAVAENYPKLQASNNFIKLHEQLVAIENQIADRREFYNDSVYLYNTRIHSVPDLIFAGLMGMRDKEYFKASEEDKKVVDVKRIGESK
jgi:LemA protein